MLVPAYMQVAGLVAAFGGVVRTWPMVRTTSGWRPDVERLPALVNARTRAIVINTPNNPTGARHGDAIVAGHRELETAAKRVAVDRGDKRLGRILQRLESGVEGA